VDAANSIVVLAVQGVVLSLGFMVLGWLMAIQYFKRQQARLGAERSFSHSHKLPPRPCCWVAVRAVSTQTVREVLALDEATPCSWAEGLSGNHEFFISPQMNGWIIITGMGLPNPTDDVDMTFLFLTALSRKLGHVQYFYASRLLRHHAWARLDDGCVTRAYAWAGETVWNQGIETLPEIQVGMKTYPYGDQSATLLDAETNFDRVPQLASRWSLDPAEVKINSAKQLIGIAGESAWI